MRLKLDMNFLIIKWLLFHDCYCSREKPYVHYFVGNDDDVARVLTHSPLDEKTNLLNASKTFIIIIAVNSI